MRKQEELKELLDRDLRERLVAEQEALVHMKLDHSITPLDNSSSIREKRRDIARIKTEIRAREIAAKSQETDRKSEAEQQ